MEKRDLEIIERHMGDDKVLAGLYDEHLEFERRLEKYNQKPYLTPSEEMDRKKLQKMKLLGRDRIESILQKYRRRGN